MGKDYKIGLICGLVAAVAVVIWLATRPSLNTRNRMFGPPRVSSQNAPSQPTAAGLIDQSTHTGRGQPQAPRAPEPQRTESPRTEPPRAGEQTPAASQPQNATPPARIHTVRSGDTLSSISQQYYGTPDAWQRIVKANASVIKNPDKVPIGTKLTIP